VAGVLVVLVNQRTSLLDIKTCTGKKHKQIYSKSTANHICCGFALNQFTANLKQTYSNSTAN
jgi:hypothetical protein